MHKYGLEKQTAAQKANQGTEGDKNPKWKPFPPQFKKDFFELIRAYSRTTVAKSKKKKLPFWSPPSFNIHARTLNKKVRKPIFDKHNKIIMNLRALKINFLSNN